MKEKILTVVIVCVACSGFFLYVGESLFVKNASNEIGVSMLGVKNVHPVSAAIMICGG